MLTTAAAAAAVLSACAAVRRRLCRAGRRETFCWRGRICVLGVLRCRRRDPAAVGLVLGGGLSNLWERLRWGRVYDYLRFPKAPGFLKRYVFNLADLAVLLGAAGLLLGRVRRPRR